jgi:signal transduction histidine kinase
MKKLKIRESSLSTEASAEWRLAVQHKRDLWTRLSTAIANAILGSAGFLLCASMLPCGLRRAVFNACKTAIAFVAGVSHELRTPLAVIQSAGANLADGVVESSDQSRKYGRLIRSEGRRLGEMVEKILDFAGIQSQRRVYDLRPTDVADLVRSTMVDNLALFENEGFLVETDMPGEEILAPAEPAAMKSAIQNLIGNAVKYADGSKWLRVSVERLDKLVTIRVHDRGLGIPSGDLPHIFEPFFRGRDVVDAQIHGSGLGLSLVKHVVDGHRGSIAVASSVHQGATFTINIPAAT